MLPPPLEYQCTSPLPESVGGDDGICFSATLTHLDLPFEARISEVVRPLGALLCIFIFPFLNVSRNGLKNVVEIVQYPLEFLETCVRTFFPQSFIDLTINHQECRDVVASTRNAQGSVFVWKFSRTHIKVNLV